MRHLYYNKLAAILRFQLPREVWVVQAGVFLNYVGWGCVMPFEVIYLHDGRGFSLGVAGLVIGVVTGLAVVAAPLAGPLIDRVGSRAIAAASLVALGAGFAGLAFAQPPPRPGSATGGFSPASRRCSPRWRRRRSGIAPPPSPASRRTSGSESAGWSEA